MEIKTEYDRYKDKYYNALSDPRLHVVHYMKINTDMHFMFKWNDEIEKWEHFPCRFLPGTTAMVDNMSIIAVIRIPPELSGVKNPKICKKDPEVARAIKDMFYKMESMSPPLCRGKYRESVARGKTH